MNDTLNNLYIDLLKKAENEKLCVRPGCTTCGCMKFRELIKEINESSLVDDIYLTDVSKLNEIFSYDFWTDATRVIHHTIGKEFRRRGSSEPQVIRHINDLYNKYLSERRLKALENIHREEEKVKNDRIVRRKHQEQHKKNKEFNEQKRDQDTRFFSQLSVTEKIRVLLEDNKHTSDYYPLSSIFEAEMDMVSIQDLELLCIKLKRQRKLKNSEVVSKLVQIINDRTQSD